MLHVLRMICIMSSTIILRNTISFFLATWKQKIKVATGNKEIEFNYSVFKEDQFV